MVDGLRALPWLVGRPHGPDDLRQVSSKHLRTVHLAILFRLFPLTLADDRVAVIAPAPHAPKLYFHCADCGSYSQTPTVSRETAVHGHLFRKYWADPLLRRRGTFSTTFLTNPRFHAPSSTAVSSLPSRTRIQSSILQHSQPHASSSQARYPKNLVANSTSPIQSLSAEPPRLRYLNLPHRPPTLTLLSSSLASERLAHFDLLDRPARRSRLVLGVVLSDGLPRLALRCAIRRQSAHRYAERLIRSKPPALVCIVWRGLPKSITSPVHRHRMYSTVLANGNLVLQITS
jgi:hypothetical protein